MPALYACRHSFAMSTPVCNVLNVSLTDVVEKSGFECCFWSALAIQTQARSFDDVKSWVFISLNVQWWNLIDNVVYCNTLRAIKAPIVELEKAMFTPALFLFRCLPSTLLVLRLTVNNQRHFMLNVTWR